MFFFFFLISFGLFAGSELCKKIKLIFKDEVYQSNQLKLHHNKEFQNQPSYKISIRGHEKTAEININGDCTDIITVLEALTTEVSMLREELAKLQKTKTEIPAKMIQPVINEPSESLEHSDKSSIFKQIIEDNVKLREM